MLKSLQIKNFKGWKDTGKIRMAPITLFFGVNSSGKSSIGQFLMMLKQTVESFDKKAVFNTGGKNSAVQLGSYRDMVYKRDPDNMISFEYEWVLKENLRINDNVSDKTFSGDSLSFYGKVGLIENNNRTVAVDSISYTLLNKEKSEISITLNRDEKSNSSYIVSSDYYPLTGKNGRKSSVRAPFQFFIFTDDTDTNNLTSSFANAFGSQQVKLFKSIHYLGPLRQKPDRIYIWTGFEPEGVGYSGENTIAAILAAKNRKVQVRKSSNDESETIFFEEAIASQLKVMDLIDEFKVDQISEDREEYEVRIRTKGSEEFVDLPDVGFGLSQVLPVLTESFYAPADSIIIIEQPEIHLHPSAQSALADVIISAAKAKENNKNRNIQFIIESHSEHFLRRLQRRIAEEVIPEDMVSAYFANVTKSPAQLEPLQINEYGNVLNWPDNFFGNEMEDIIKQSKAALKRRIAQQESENSDDK